MNLLRFLAPVALALGLFACTPAQPDAPSQTQVTAPISAAPCPQRKKPNIVTGVFGALTPRPQPGEGIVMEVGDIERFCNDPTVSSVLCAGGGDAALPLEQVVRIDAALRAKFYYTPDDLMFGKEDYWSSNTVCGDCEDYALTVAEMLHTAGQGGSKMALMIWAPGGTSGHATLLVETADAGVVEIGVGVYETPMPFQETRPVRLGSVLMDGDLSVDLRPGFSIWRGGAGEIFIGQDSENPDLLKTASPGQ
ncbi:putative transglutaminase-like cysteine peptidase [Bajunvirus bajun]|uniref:Transglutaminase-like cysteine peptidase n=1 Tax=Brevundimonas phage vB_BgoS-Bajun TaxID=2948594 RepID=A0A9E7SUV7_9CAUD|nr:putative transglutaminase-like cysteine peptidase [Brevundimonas phage vB_BgoS-Bajun]